MTGVESSRFEVAQRDTSLISNVIRFCRLLRLWGLRLHADAARSALEALGEIDITRREDFRHALRIVLVRSPEDFPLFDYMFNAYWATRMPKRSSDPPHRPVDGRRLGRTVSGSGELGPRESGAMQLGRSVGPAPMEDPDAAPETTNAAATGVVRSITATEGTGRLWVAELDRLARKLSPVLATCRSRRWVRNRAGRSLNPRGLLRSNLRHGGLLIDVPRRERRMTRTRLVLFCDVSRSMDEHTALFLHFAAAALRRLWKVEVFLFATELVRVTRVWGHEGWESLRRRVPECGGGTQIGRCLERFLFHYESSLLGRNTVVMVLSDGLDAGEPAVLERAMESLQRRSRAIFWLNPVAHLPGYEPTARGMAAALKYVDVFAPVHNMASLWAIVDHLRTASTRSGLARSRLQRSERRFSRRASEEQRAG